MLRHPLPPSPGHLLGCVKHQVPLLGSVSRPHGTLGICFAAPQVPSDAVTSSCSHHPLHSALKPNESPAHSKCFQKRDSEYSGSRNLQNLRAVLHLAFWSKAVPAGWCACSVCCQLIQTPLVGLTNNTSTLILESCGLPASSSTLLTNNFLWWYHKHCYKMLEKHATVITPRRDKGTRSKHQHASFLLLCLQVPWWWQTRPKAQSLWLLKCGSRGCCHRRWDAHGAPLGLREQGRSTRLCARMVCPSKALMKQKIAGTTRGLQLYE